MSESSAPFLPVRTSNSGRRVESDYYARSALDELGRVTPDGLRWRFEKLAEVLTYLQFDSVFEVVLTIDKFYDIIPSEYRNQLRMFVTNGGLTKLLDFCRRINIFKDLAEDENSKLRVSICSHAHDVYESEWRELTADPEIKKPVAQFSNDYVSSFSMAGIYQRMRANAPHLFVLLEGLGAKPGEVSSNYGEHGADEEQRRRWRHIVVAVSTLSQLRTRRINVVQGILTYFLYASRVPKRVITVLNHLGLTVSYSSLKSALDSNAKSLRDDLKSRGIKGMATEVSIDNLAAAANVRDERLYKKASYLTYTAGFVVEPSPARAIPMFTRANIDYNAVQRLTIRDFLPSDEDQSILRSAFRAMSFKVLKKFGKQHNLSFPNVQFQMPDVDVLDHKDRSRFHVLPTYDLDESRIDEMINIIYEISEDIGLSELQVKEAIMMFKGDYMTVKNIRLYGFGDELILDEARRDRPSVLQPKG